MPDIPYENVIGQQKLEIGDRISTYRDVGPDGKRYVRANGDLLDPVEYPLLAAMISLSFAPTDEVIVGLSSPLGYRAAVDQVSQKVYVTTTNGLLLEVDNQTREYSTLLNPNGDLISSVFISDDKQTIVAVSRFSATYNVRFQRSEDGGATFLAEASITSAGTESHTSVALTANSDCSIQYVVASAAGTQDDIKIIRRDGSAAPAEIHDLNGLANPFVSEKTTVCTDDGEYLFFFDSVGSALWRYQYSTDTPTQITPNIPTSEAISHLAIDPSNGRLFAFIPSAGLYYSDDFGGTWSIVELPGASYTSCAIEAKNGVLLYIASNTDLEQQLTGAWLSNDIGVTWYPVSDSFRHYKLNVDAVSLDVTGAGAGQEVVLTFHEQSEDDVTTITCEYNKFIVKSDDPISKIVADEAGA